ncbi:FAD-binding oxidoreductase [Acidocella sp.]|uniref:FAD-binding oxidoreductase n=1 Tax=Acidocella sp. TaxID=50710 RepID=UPI002610DE95|nr:FAD-binding oxidoreductase [Acidocella sp.]
MEFVTDLRAVLGDGGMLISAADRAAYERDWRGLVNNPALAVLLPKNTQQVSEIVKLCARYGAAIVPQGGNTGLVAGAVPVEGRRQVVLSLARMKAVRGIDLATDAITVDAGLTLKELQDQAFESGRLFPVSLGAEGSAQVGGVISTNAGGMQVLSYGSMRAQVLGLEVVLADGRIWQGLNALRKDNTGYDLKQLFIGGEGTLGVITAATLKLSPAIKARGSALVGVGSVAAAVALFQAARDALGTALTLCEFMDAPAALLGAAHSPRRRLPFAAPGYVLLEASSLDEGRLPNDLLQHVLETALEKGLALDAVIAQSGRERDELIALREAISAGELAEGGAVKHDITVPVGRVAEMVTATNKLIIKNYPGCRPNVFGHLGDGNLHINIRPPEGRRVADLAPVKEAISRAIEGLAVSMAGSFSAEHGIGQLRLAGMLTHKSAVELDMMRAIKSALDPAGLFNPGKTIPGVS